MSGNPVGTRTRDLTLTRAGLLTRDEQRAARGVGGWAVMRLLTDPDAGWQGGEYGGSSTAERWPTGCGTEYRTKGARILGPYAAGRQVLAEVTWKTVAKYAATLPHDLRMRLAGHLDAARAHQRAYRLFAASAKACGCGMPSRWVHPITEAQALYAAEYDAYERDVLRPWQAENQRLRAAAAALLDEAFPLAADHEPTDLLELLEAMA